VLAGLPAYLIRQLQSVLNAAARLIYRLRSHDHITDALISLHWLRSQSACSTSSLFSRTRSYMEALHLIWVHSSASLIYLVDERCVLLTPIVLLCDAPVKLSTVGSRAYLVAAAMEQLA